MQEYLPKLCIIKSKKYMMYLSVCATLLTMIGTMHLLAKTNKEAPGSFFKWVSSAVPGVAPLVSNFNGMKRYIFLACLFCLVRLFSDTKIQVF